MQTKGSFAISLILHVILLVLLYERINIHLLIPSFALEASPGNIQIDNLNMEPHVDDKVSVTGEKNKENFFDRPDSERRNLSAAEKSKIFSNSKNVLKESRPLNVSFSSKNKLQRHDIRKTSEQKVNNRGSVGKKSIDPVLMRAEQKILVSKMKHKNDPRIPSQNEINTVRRRIAESWNISPDVKKLKEIRIRTHFQLNRDGLIVGSPNIMVVGGTEITRQILRDDVKRAIMKSQPFHLPLGRYENWRNMNLNFAISQM
ncbi:MAG: hypothetical protein EU981_04035 [Candidatus Liberibacter ctenarytainae]|uniref:TolA protein n=1 Tax=Candidatus Liberibacter ctenarytainae TaxID=2020335 RepID=A0A937AM12_9HYPH|nr:hypothetical protein [Candidatus Liberibacter ctenarytainae]